MSKQLHSAIKIGRLTIVIVILIIAIAVVPERAAQVQPAENIHGVAFPETAGVVQVYERLAHSDIVIGTPTLARQLQVTVTFTPHTIGLLELGIRQGSFWLSYPRHTLFEQSKGQNTTKPVTRSIFIPLTDKLADQDNSVDLMFFADWDGSYDTIDLGTSDTTFWELHALSATGTLAVPTLVHMNQFLINTLLRSRPL